MQPNSNILTNVSAQAEERTPCHDQTPGFSLLPISPMIHRSQAAFRRDLPVLMKTHYGQGVAYHGEQRLGFARSKFKLVQECLRRGLKDEEYVDEEYVVRGIAPEMPDDDERVV